MKKMRKLFLITMGLFLGVFIFGYNLVYTYAQTTPSNTATDVATNTPSTLVSLLENVGGAPSVNLTQPEDKILKREIATLFEKREIQNPTFFNAFGYWVQHAIDLGLPANTIILILLAPIIASLVLFTRTIIGLPSLDMFVPTALAYALIAINIGTGLLILGLVIGAAFTSRFLLKRLPVMSLPKRALTHLVLAIFVFAALTASLSLGFESVKDLSIFPVLILMLLGDSIVSVQLHKTARETILISSVTITLGLIGYYMATSLPIRNTLLLWPEVVFLVVPLNFVVGRYFGLRLTEIFRFNTLETYGSE